MRFYSNPEERIAPQTSELLSEELRSKASGMFADEGYY